MFQPDVNGFLTSDLHATQPPAERCRIYIVVFHE